MNVTKVAQMVAPVQPTSWGQTGASCAERPSSTQLNQVSSTIASGLRSLVLIVSTLNMSTNTPASNEYRITPWVVLSVDDVIPYVKLAVGKAHMFLFANASKIGTETNVASETWSTA